MKIQVKTKFIRAAMGTLLMLVLCLSTLIACFPPQTDPDVPLYTEDTELGEGETTLAIRVTADELSVLFTIHTDETTVGAALAEHGLVEGEMGAYGLYVKRVNGILADYDVDGSWWGFYIDGEMAMTGVDSTEIAPGTSYELRKEK